MPSRRPPSQRDPAYALHRLPGTVAQAAPGLKVKNAAPIKASTPDRTAAAPAAASGSDLRTLYMGSHSIGSWEYSQHSGLDFLVKQWMLPLDAGMDVITGIDTGSGSFSNCALEVHKLADSNGTILGYGTGPTAGRTQTGSGLTTISYPAFTPTAYYDVPTTDSDAGFQVLTAGWYWIRVFIIWDA